MKFTFSFYEQAAGPKAAPILKPLTLDLASVELARSMLDKLTGTKEWRRLAVEIDSEDGTISERWFRKISGWTQSDIKDV